MSGSRHKRMTAVRLLKE